MPFNWFDIKRFKALLVRWIVYCHVAFIQMENVYFRELLAHFNGRMAAFVP